jgi:single-strand DNA-binding protein
MNLVQLCGRLAHTPELKALPSGLKVAEMSVATNYSVKNKETEQWEQQTDWHSVKAFGRTAENMATYLRGGDQVIIQGKLKTHVWQKEGEATKRYNTSVIVDTFDFGAKNPKRDDHGQAPVAKTTKTPSQNLDEQWDNLQAPTKVEQYDDSIDYPQEEINAEDIPF